LKWALITGYAILAAFLGGAIYAIFGTFVWLVYLVGVFFAGRYVRKAVESIGDKF
jgi:hypothetical protein